MLRRMPITRGIVLLTALACAVVVTLVWEIPMVRAAMRAYQGNVTINDNVAANGTEITVSVDGKSGICGSTLTSGGRYVVYITDSGGSCPDPGSTPTISFSVNNIAVGSITFNPEDGVQAVDLVVNQAGEALSGRAMVGGTAATPGTVVVATVLGGTSACVSTQVGAFGEYQMVVPPATNTTPNCPNPGQQVTFTLNGLATTERIPFEPARSRTVDLNAQPAGHTVSGTATVGGAPAANAPIQAFVGQTVCGATTSDAQGRFNLTVSAAVQQTGCGASDTTIIFNVGSQRASQSVQFQSGGNTTGINLSVVTLTCVYSDQSPPDRVTTSEMRPIISVNVTCTTPPGAVTMSVDTAMVTPVVSVSGNTRSIRYTPPAPLSNGFHIVTVGIAAAEPTTWTFSVGQTVSVGEWFDRPPSAQGGAHACPPAKQWRLLYWNGPSDVPIGIAALSCPEAEVLWLNRQGRWYGFSRGAPAVSDTWNAVTGEANFIRGQ